uniref:Alpha-galactosidase NEW3 domain-containing protein n=1 Tax=Candidatus Methanosuratincola petrocarbonis (ex Vanwonterghem et al. 2016) TaxID=1867261 RepID=A0A7J3UYI4_9CREN
MKKCVVYPNWQAVRSPNLRLILPIALIALSFASMTGLVSSGSAWTRSNFQVVKPGGTASFDIQLSLYSGTYQDGWSGDTYKLSTTGLPEGWTARFLYSGTEVKSLNIKVGESVTIKMEITVPQSTDTGDYSITFKATGTNDVITLPLNVEVSPLQRKLDLASTTLHIYNEIGQNVRFPLTLSNNGEITETINLSISAPEGWNAQFLTSDGKTVLSLILAPASSRSLELVLTPPKDVNPSDYSFVVKATSQDGSVSASATLIATLGKSAGIALTTALPHQLSHGKSLSYPITLKNSGVNGTFTLSVSGLPKGWSSCFKSGTSEILSLFLDSGASVTVNLEVTPSENSIGTYQIVVRVFDESGLQVASLPLLATISAPDRGLAMTPSYTGLSVESGSSATFTITLANTGETDELVSLKTAAPEGWTVKISAQDQSASISNICLQSGQKSTLTLKVTPPDNAVLGTYNLTITAASSDGLLFSSLPLTISLVEPSGTISVLTTFKEVTVQAGAVLKYPITIKNQWNTDELLYLSADVPQNWAVAFMSGDTSISSLLLASGQSIDLVVKVTPPSTVAIGNYTTTIKVRSDDGKFSYALDLKSKIVGSYGLQLTPSTYNTATTTGSSTSITVRVTNTGLSPLSSLKLSVSPPSEYWEVTTTPSQISSLAPGESVTFSITIKSPADSVAGDYMITMRAYSDQTSSDQVQVRVTLSASASWTIYGVLVAVATMVVLVAIFKKFGRR